MEAEYSAGVAQTGNYMLVCFDCSEATAIQLLGASGTAVPIESLDADILVYHVSPNVPKRANFSEPLAYAANAGFKGNAWVKTLDAVNTLDGVFYGIDKS